MVLPKTQLVYHGDTYLFSLTARILSLRMSEAKSVLILDRTLFYPQGGGQPSDIGTIRAASGTMQVSMVRNVQGIVEHEGVFSEGSFSEGEQVNLEIDQSVRLLHSRIHSGGHLLDHAAQLLQLPIIGSKGYHFPSGPYVEYTITAADFDTSPPALADLKNRWEEKSRQMISEHRRITVTNCKPSELSADVLASLPAKARESDEVRLIHFEDTPLPGPCGGTHVSNTSEIGDFSIKKISFKSGILRVSYSV